MERPHYPFKWEIEEYHLKELVGLSGPELFARFPNYSWQVLDAGRLFPVKIKAFVTVDYDTVKPREEVDIFGHVFVGQGEESLKKEFTRQLSDRTAGITSMVLVSDEEFGYRPLHIPFIDLDLQNSDVDAQERLIEIENEIKEKTEIGNGVFLSSGRPSHFHFIGIGRLLTQEDLVTFMGACQLIGSRDTVDSRWVGHSLVPMFHRKEFDTSFSIYDFSDRFATLRLTGSELKPEVPQVIRVM